MREIKEIIIHCTSTEENKNFHASDIKRWHTLPPPAGRGWQNIGYHFVINLDGTVEAGRPLSSVGAHCVGHNSNSIGIVYVGGLRKGIPTDTRTEAQRTAVRALVQTLKIVYQIKEVHGHNEFSTKACPCFNVKRECF